MSFGALGVNGNPTSCVATLTVSEYESELASSCFANLIVTGCLTDCEGQVNGIKKFDVCGVCGGDNSTCRQCNRLDIREVQILMDGNAAKQKQLVLKLLNLLPKNNKYSPFISSTKKSANALYTESWSTLFTKIPGVFQSCNIDAACTTMNVQSNVGSFVSNVNQLYSLSRKTYELIRRAAAKNTRRAQILLNRHRLENKASKELAAKIPASSTEC